uniref:Tim44-like domain-containing protein n=1 Tax=Caenorhabditis japonica TaxID=281687 RepID=A0A8R1EQF6_CAEJA
MLRRSLQSGIALSQNAVHTVTAATTVLDVNPILPTNRAYIFDTPHVTVPTFEMSRRLGNLFSQSFYTLFYERNFSVESLVHGANKGIHSMAHFLADEKWDQMENLVAKETVDGMRVARAGISKRLEDGLRFSPDDILISFLHSSVISGRDVLKLSNSRNIGIYFTVVSFVRLSEKVPENASIAELNGKFKNDVLVCNATFSRVLNPLGVWKITSGNFFL